MRYELSPGLEHALGRAIAWAEHDRSPQVQPAHLWQALIEDRERRAWQLLEEFGLARQAIGDAWLRNAPADDVSFSGLPLAEAVREVFAGARALARHVSPEETLTSELALLALLQSEDRLREQLVEAGLDFARLEEAICPPPPIVELEDEKPAETAPAFDTARLLDACANRAREGLRVLEDSTRFLLNDPFLSRQLKDLRHTLASILGQFPPAMLLTARDTLHDVGTTISTPQECERASLQAVIQANARRLQEALRSLEEFGKLSSPGLAQQIEQLRYRSYTLEQALILGWNARERLAGARLYALVGEEQGRYSLGGTVAEILAGGVQIVQLREKNVDDRTLLARAREVRRLTWQAGALFIVNDRPDLARLAEADGVHLGQDDLPVQEARRIVGPDLLVGVSTHDLDQVRQAVLDGASYIGVGPTFPSRTKSFREFPGLEFARAAVAETSLPAFVLGGVNLENLDQVLACGVGRVAVSHAICSALDPREASQEFRRKLNTRPLV